VGILVGGVVRVLNGIAIGISDAMGALVQLSVGDAVGI
jgi:hypothetical protein